MKKPEQTPGFFVYYFDKKTGARCFILMKIE